MKILVVDDDPQILDALTVGLQLQWQDAEVLAADGRRGRGWHAFYEHAPDVVVLDVTCPARTASRCCRRSAASRTCR